MSLREKIAGRIGWELHNAGMAVVPNDGVCMHDRLLAAADGAIAELRDQLMQKESMDKAVAAFWHWNREEVDLFIERNHCKVANPSRMLIALLAGLGEDFVNVR